MSVQTKSTPFFMPYRYAPVKKPTYLEKAMAAFFAQNFAQFAKNLAEAKAHGENLNAICPQTNETLATLLTKQPRSAYLDEAAQYNIDWSAKNHYGETVSSIRAYHATTASPNGPAFTALLDSFFDKLAKLQVKAAKEQSVDAVVNVENKVTEAEAAAKAGQEAAAKAEQEAKDAVVNAVNKATEAEAAKEEAVDAVVNAVNKATEAADMLIPAIVEPTDAQVSGDTDQNPTDIMDHMRDFGGF